MAEIDREILIPPNLLQIYKHGGSKRGQRHWYCKVYINRETRPTRSLKTTDKEEAKRLAYELFAELKTQSKTTGSTSPKDVDSLCRRWVRHRELMHKNGEKGGSLPSVNRHRNTIGTLLPAFCKYQKWKKPKDFPRDFASKYIEWRREEGWKITGSNGGSKAKSGSNTTAVMPKESTIFLELQTIRQWSDQLVEEGILPKAIRIPKRSGFVPADEIDDLEANPPFTPSDYKKITAAYRRWIKKDDQLMDQRLKKVIYWHFLINCSVGWRCYSEGLEAKWNWIKQIYPEKQTIKNIEQDILIAKIKIVDRKRNKLREGYFVHAHHFVELKKFYDECHENDKDCFKPKLDSHIFVNPLTGSPLSRHQLYDTLKEKILPDCDLQRTNYTYYSTRSFMITKRFEEGADPYQIHKYTGHELGVLQRHYERMDLAKSASRGTVISYSGNKKNTGVELF